MACQLTIGTVYMMEVAAVVDPLIRAFGEYTGSSAAISLPAVGHVIDDNVNNHINTCCITGLDHCSQLGLGA